MNPEWPFTVRKVWELVELCAERRRRCRSVNMHDFRNALDSWEIGRKEVYAACGSWSRKTCLLTMTRGGGSEWALADELHAIGRMNGLGNYVLTRDAFVTIPRISFEEWKGGKR